MYYVARCVSPLVALVSFAGCSGAPYTVSDGTYILQMQPEDAPAPQGKPLQEEVQLRIGRDGTIEFLDNLGRAAIQIRKMANTLAMYGAVLRTCHLRGGAFHGENYLTNPHTFATAINQRAVPGYSETILAVSIVAPILGSLA